MTERLEILPVEKPVKGRIRPPGSKSITNRALLCAALADGESLLTGALDSEDTRVMVDSLTELGIAIDTQDERGALRVSGCGGTIPANQADLFVAGSGTTMRFLTAAVTLGSGRYRLHGIDRMHERPIGDLIAALLQLGADARSERGNDRPPVIVEANGLPGGRATIRGDVSSQFLSGLLMTCPCAAQAVELTVEGQLVSKPYVQMTLGVMEEFGVRVETDQSRSFHITPQTYQARSLAIEPDASAAGYFLAAAAITGGQVTIEGLGLGSGSLQGDVAFADCLRQMGCEVEYEEDWITVSGRSLSGITVDMNPISDTVQTLAVVALFADGPTTITGVAHIRHKESDRIGDLARELRKLGAAVDESDDGLTIHPNPLCGAQIETYNDHRMAMSLALAGLRVPGVVILDPGCTGKTYPRFFGDLQALCGR